MVLDKLLLTFGLTLLNGAVLNEPMRANESDPNFTFYNSTPYELKFVDGYSDDEYIVPSNTSLAIEHTYHNANDFYVYMKEDWDEAETLWYECLDSIGIPATPDWNYQQDEWNSYFNVQGLISTAHGIGVYKYEYYSNQDLYIDPNKWGGIAKGINDYNGNFRITPENTSNVKIYKENGTYNTATKIYAARTSFDESFNYATIVYAVINNQNVMLANNFGYKETIINGAPSPADPKAIQPYLTYYNGWTNRVSLGNAELQKAAESNPNTGYMPLGYPYLTDVPIGYIAMGDSTESETSTVLMAGFTFAYWAFTAIAPIFSFVVFPGVSIGLLICIPLIMTLMFAVIRIIKKGS